MSEKKMFTAEEVARMLLEKAHNTLKKHEDILKKSKNTAHEIDAGEEPKNDEAECPDSLKGEGNSTASKSESKKENSPAAESENAEMEDEPLSDDESEEESDENEEDEEESEYEFKKSESGMHTIVYKTLKKAESPGMAGPRQPNWISDRITAMQAKQNQSAAPAPIKKEENHPQKEKPEHQIKKFGSQGAPLGSNLGASIAAGLGGVKKEENQPPKENPQYHIRATQEGKAPKKTWTTATRKEVDYSRSGMKGAKPSSPEDQKRFEAEAKERAKKFKEKK
jgi:hypothetical protein